MATPRRLAIRSAKQTQAALEAVETQAGQIVALQQAVEALTGKVEQLIAVLAAGEPPSQPAKRVATRK